MGITLVFVHALLSLPYVDTIDDSMCATYSCVCFVLFDFVCMMYMVSVSAYLYELCSYAYASYHYRSVYNYSIALFVIAV